ncbi:MULTISPECIES: hypothetical protein [unclassified Microcoleus]|uniref:hypothetical protein n=1 Tax=unclassified Microcoleus TaxID=2642155 RepID=UPI002FD4CD07
MPFPVVAGELTSCLNWANSTIRRRSPKHRWMQERPASVASAKSSSIAEATARWVADSQFDSMSSVMGDRAVPQVARSLPKCDGKVAAIDACAATKTATTARAM